MGLTLQHPRPLQPGKAKQNAPHGTRTRLPAALHARQTPVIGTFASPIQNMRDARAQVRSRLFCMANPNIGRHQPIPYYQFPATSEKHVAPPCFSKSHGTRATLLLPAAKPCYPPNPTRPRAASFRSAAAHSRARQHTAGRAHSRARQTLPVPAVPSTPLHDCSTNVGDTASHGAHVQGRVHGAICCRGSVCGGGDEFRLRSRLRCGSRFD